MYIFLLAISRGILFYCQSNEIKSKGIWVLRFRESKIREREREREFVLRICCSNCVSIFGLYSKGDFVMERERWVRVV